jgi:ubiquinone/menaquinone biosynthesis C-methylase UbiE
VVGDATALPFADGAFETVLNGVSLMHILRYDLAVAESRRVARRWCIFHTVPITQKRPTTVLRKLAYGGPVVEIVLNEKELLTLIENHGLRVRQVFESIPHIYLDKVLSDTVSARTYLCETT